ncbi:MAG: cation:proton antiporter [Phycisphaerales bacterium JB059]
MDLWSALFSILVLLTAALVLGVLCERLRQSPILGYLLAGTLLGPNAFALIADTAEVAALAELGVALLLFTIGLEFSWGRLRRLGPAALFGGAAQVVLTAGAGFALSLAFGLSPGPAFAIGAIVALSSTAVVLRLLVARAQIESVHGRHVLGVLLIQDVAVVPLVLLVTVFGADADASGVLLDILRTILWAGVLVLAFYVLFNIIVPRILVLQSLQRNRDLPVLLAIVTGLGAAWGAHTLGLSPALGAFAAGMLLAESPFSTQIRSDVAPLRTLLVTLFFSSIGMVGDPGWLAAHIPAVLAIVLAIVLGKATIVWGLLRLFRLPHAHALAAGLCLGQVGEFSFVLAEIARGQLLSDDLFKLMISATIVTLFLTPYLVAWGPGVAHALVSRLQHARLLAPPASNPPRPDTPAPPRVLVVGFGPTGRVVTESVLRMGERVVVIDLNPRVLRAADSPGLTPQLGDARHADVLEHAGVESIGVAVLTIPDTETCRAVADRISAMAPAAHVIVRARYNRSLEELTDAADEIIDEERSVGLRLAARVRRRLRATTPPQAPEDDD